MPPPTESINSSLVARPYPIHQRERCKNDVSHYRVAHECGGYICEAVEVVILSLI